MRLCKTEKDNFFYRKQRGVFTLCFFVLCILDWMKSSLNGRLQMIATNSTGIVVAFVIICALGVKSFSKKKSFIWFIMCIAAFPIATILILKHIPYRGQIISAEINVFMYGVILIRVIPNFLSNDGIKKIRIPIFAGWLLMLLLMLFSVNENIWPIWYALVFGSFYCLQIDKEIQNTLLNSIIDGILLGFIALQGMAFLFRPYDIYRYLGMYINPNFNALFYLMVYSALLCRWYILKRDNAGYFIRLIVILLSGTMYGFCIFTGCKAALLSMSCVTLGFTIYYLRIIDHKVFEFFRIWISLGVIAIFSIPIVYYGIRYLPTLHLHPLFFEGEYSEDRVLPGEPSDSEKYISYEYAVKVNAERLFYYIPNSSDLFRLGFVMKVKAAGLTELDETEEYLFSQEEVNEGVDPIKLRLKIYKYYWDRLNLWGHKNNYRSAMLYENASAPHAHNAFIQIAFLYGIPAGILFVAMAILSILGSIRQLLAGNDTNSLIMLCFSLSFIVFGLFEVDWMCGQLPFTLYFLLFRGTVRTCD